MNERENILNSITNTGGLMKRIAEMYWNDEELADQFIVECYNECHIAEVSSFWGDELVSKMENYVKKMPVKAHFP